MIGQNRHIDLECSTRLSFSNKRKMLDILNNYDGPTYVNIKYGHVINFN